MNVFEVKKYQNPNGMIMIEEKRAFSYPLHTHTYCEMMLYESYDGVITVNGYELTVSGSAAILLTPLDFHSISFRGDERAKYIKVGFNPEILKGAAPELPMVYYGAAEDGFFRSLFYEMKRESEDDVALSLLIGCAVHIMQRRGVSVGKPSQSVARSALKLINDRFREPLSLEDVARELKISPQHLSSTFKESFGVNFSRYLIDLRLRYAKELIDSTDASVTDVCYESGFANFSHFSRSFKRAFGVSPRTRRDSSKSTELIK